MVFIELHRCPWQSVRTAIHVQPRERVRKNVGLRLARPPERQQLRAVSVPIVPHVVADEGRQSVGNVSAATETRQGLLGHSVIKARC